MAYTPKQMAPPEIATLLAQRAANSDVEVRGHPEYGHPDFQLRYRQHHYDCRCQSCLKRSMYPSTFYWHFIQKGLFLRTRAVGREHIVRLEEIGNSQDLDAACDRLTATKVTGCEHIAMALRFACDLVFGEGALKAATRSGKRISVSDILELRKPIPAPPGSCPVWDPQEEE